MDGTLDLIGKRTYRAGNVIINIPTVGMIRDDNGNRLFNFWQEAGLFTKTPSDMISELADLGIDFEELSDFKLFLLLFLGTKGLNGNRESILFKDFNLYSLKPNEELTALIDDKGNEIITEGGYTEISDVICLMLCHDKTKPKKFGNKFSKQKYIEFDRKKKERAAAQRQETQQGNMIGSVILRLVCSGKLPYTFQSINEITIYEMLWSIKQIDKEIGVNDLMQSRLVGADLTKVPGNALSRYVI